MEFKPEAALLGAIVKFLLLIKKILVNFGGKLSYFLFQHLITTIICIYLHRFIVTILAEVFSECIERHKVTQLPSHSVVKLQSTQCNKVDFSCN